MNKYRVFYDERTEQAEIIRYGFSFWAFFFNIFYFLFKGAWRSALMWMAGGFFLSILGEAVFKLPEAVFLIISLVFNVYCGFEAADCLIGEARLKKKYVDFGIVSAHSQDDALVIALRQRD